MNNRMIRTILYLIPGALLCAACLSAQAPAGSLKDEAVALFERHDYHGAIGTLKLALKQDPEDAEIHYYLGYFTHYLCYDSVPLTGFGRGKSDEVLEHLRRAVELDPGLGNAYYFIGAEYGARARQAMQDGRPEDIPVQFRLGYEEGGYPEWLIEFGRNMLRSCERGAILFTGGDGDTNPAQYLQYVEGYRTDVTVIPVALLERPWMLSLLKNGARGVVGTAPISWTESQIQSMHPYKWRTNIIGIPVPEEVRPERGAGDEAVEYELAPDLTCGDGAGRLSAGRAALADILVTNAWRRPVYFSMGCSRRAFEGLEDHLQLHGFARRLLPYEPTSRTDTERTAGLLMSPESFEHLPAVRERDMPRISGMMQNYRVCHLMLVSDLLKEGNVEEARRIFSMMKEYIPEEVLPVSQGLRSTIDAIEQRLR